MNYVAAEAYAKLESMHHYLTLSPAHRNTDWSTIEAMQEITRAQYEVQHEGRLNLDLCSTIYFECRNHYRNLDWETL